jgi:hexokinase
MEKGLSGDDASSLLMLPSFALVDSEIKLNQKIAVIDAGGTNLRFGCVWFNSGGEYQIENFKKQSMLGTETALNKDEFFSGLAELVLPYLEATNLIVISFAYPTTITENMDGQIIKLVKELKVSGVDGSLIGEELAKHLSNFGKPDVRVMVTNDTTATAFAGKAETMGQNFQSHIGVIVGTGMNTCYPEKMDAIGKLPHHTGDARMMINTESGGFDKILRSQIDKAFDASTTDEGYHVLEKMVSGGYIGGLCDAYIKAAAKQGYFTPSTSQKLLQVDLNAIDISAFLTKEPSATLCKLVTERADIDNMHLLLKRIIRRAANLAALQIYALAKKCSQPGDNICVTVEGTTFYKLPGMQKQTQEFLDLYMTKAGFTYQILTVDDAVMKGSAAIGLQQ